MNLLAWRNWKLKRKAIGSNDAEVQSILEAEDQNFRIRMLWSELHGAGLNRPERRADLVAAAEERKPVWLLEFSALTRVVATTR